jgi:hypothetical protein
MALKVSETIAIGVILRFDFIFKGYTGRHMLMVVFGAGASYDSSSDFPPPPRTRMNSPDAWRPPLANSLFSNPQRAFSYIVKEYPKLTHVLPYLRERSGNRSVEEILEHLRDEAKDYPERLREIASIQYYLRDLLFEVTAKWLDAIDRVTNYAVLIGELLRLNTSDEPICLVTFNYDLLLDSAARVAGEALEACHSDPIIGQEAPG